MREHLIMCFENGKLTPFPKYNLNQNYRAQPISPITAKQITDIFHIISGKILNEKEISVLEKGLSFCPTTPELNYEELMGDLFSFCRKQRLKRITFTTSTRHQIIK